MQAAKALQSPFAVTRHWWMVGLRAQSFSQLREPRWQLSSILQLASQKPPAAGVLPASGGLAYGSRGAGPVIEALPRGTVLIGLLALPVAMSAASIVGDTVAASAGVAAATGAVAGAGAGLSPRFIAKNTTPAPAITASAPASSSAHGRPPTWWICSLLPPLVGSVCSATPGIPAGGVASGAPAIGSGVTGVDDPPASGSATGGHSDSRANACAISLALAKRCFGS